MLRLMKDLNSNMFYFYIHMLYNITVNKTDILKDAIYGKQRTKK